MKDGFNVRGPISMSEIWLISDTHFGHHNIIKYCNRPFQTHWEMDEYILEKWNSVVKPGDKVYHLGDVYFPGGYEDKNHFWKWLGLLNGSKRLVLGNHDDAKNQALHKHFKKIVMWRYFKEFNLLLTHVPVHESSLVGKNNRPTVNVHGHIHNHPSPKGPYKCVCVEQIDYTPINIEELKV